jgi:hypothetical protein
MVMNKIGGPLVWTELLDRRPRAGEIRVSIAACGVFRTYLHVLDGELPDQPVPMIPGHQIVGRIDAVGGGVSSLRLGARVGVPWLGHTCGICPYCIGHRENLRQPVVHRLYTRRQFCDLGHHRRALRLSVGRGGRRCRARALALRGTDRLAFARYGGRCEEGWVVRIWRGGAHCCSSRAMAGAIGLRVYQTRRRSRPDLCQKSGRSLGGRVGRNPARSARCGDHLCDCRRSRSASSEGDPQRRVRLFAPEYR